MTAFQRIAAIHDISGYGKCSLTIAIPVLSSMGLEVCPLPTAVLSSHTGINNFSFIDLTENMKNTITHWNEMKLRFSCIYTGFLGSESQFELVKRFIGTFGGTALKFIDPVMGDNGTIYSTYSKKMCENMKSLVSLADVITPNVTEAAILLDEEYPKNGLDSHTANNWLKRLANLGPRYAVITGNEIDGYIYNYAYDKVLNKFCTTQTKKLPINLSGTGDLFSSVLVGAVLNDLPLCVSLELSADFVYTSILNTMNSGRNERDGIQFEQLLCSLSANMIRPR